MGIHYSQPALKSSEKPPVDAVYMWVDGSATNFKEQLGIYLEKERPNPSAALPRRFSDNDELKYSLRSVCKFAPWIRQIFIVTNGQRPSWLNSKHPKIKLIEHSSIFDSSEALPTFNSLAIEWQLHRIPGLSEYFLQLNDDFFLGRTLTPEDLFTEQGGLKLYFETSLISQKASANIFHASNSQTVVALQRICGESLKLHFPAHVPRLFKRSIIEELELALPEEIRRTTHSRFRSSTDLFLPAAHAGWIKSKNRPIDQEIFLDEPSELYRFLRLDGAWWWWSRSLIDMAIRKPKFYCINDDLQPGKLAWIARRALHTFCRTVLNNPSPFESQ